MTDKELWHKILSGDEESWAILVKRYQSLVYAVATRSGLSSADIADCFQQTWVSCYNHRAKLQDPSRISAWLVTTAKREAIRLSKLDSRKSSEANKLDQIDTNPLPDEELTHLENQAQLEIAIDQLDSRCRNLIELLFFGPENLSYEQIALSLGITFNSLGPIRKRCLDRLKKILLKNGFEGIRKDDSDPL